MKSKIRTLGITGSLILVVLFSSCTSPFQIIDSFHNYIHSISSMISGEHSHEHSHDFLDRLEKQENDDQKKKYVLDKNSWKIINSLIVFASEDLDSNFQNISSRIIDMLDSFHPIVLDKPPIG